jgi:vitamin-K-epoxide reductase (warfarin-sensitive)
MVIVVLGIFSNLLSVYLAYILYKINDICVVCVLTYIVNAAIMIFAIKKMRKLSADDARKKKMK